MTWWSPRGRRTRAPVRTPLSVHIDLDPGKQRSCSAAGPHLLRAQSCIIGKK
ncbi:hypothetical protein DM02DRAFT_437016 [Periconia macrospinosa]|uniref:Uncharacterized protein n=1 Tax=Periconia macrospinosa TaxID=97972 RepID=A0A2V1DN81_9PLEO|nr:hypothetical protein DM02DRAFT_437016 [Periconia macrospinosa]